MEHAMTVDVQALRIDNGKVSHDTETLAREEPLEIWVNNKPYIMVMRTPGEETALALGICMSEGLIDGMADLSGISFCKDASSNRIQVTLTPRRTQMVEELLQREAFMSYSSCGLCGKQMVNELCRDFKVVDDLTKISVERLFEHAAALKKAQRIFPVTGGVHGAALFDSTGDLMAFAEDVGRHNAFDKAIGKALGAPRPRRPLLAFISSRAGFEIVQKAARMQIPILACVSAPTQLGVTLAQQCNITLLGFVRPPRANIYSVPERISI